VQALAQAPSIEASASQRRLHYDYRFENDSSFDTPFLVPHFFEQHYEVSGPELAVTARYGRGRLATTVSFAPEASATGSDFDTFFQPDGDVATSGTDGGVLLTSLGIRQSISLVEREEWDAAVTFEWRRDTAEFLPADRVVTHTQPPSTTREFITDRETTTSQVFGAGVEARWHRRGLAVAVYGSPAMRARLLVLLPDKYPGRDIVFTALSWTAGARATYVRPIGPIEAGVWISGDASRPYRNSARYARSAVAAGLSAAFRFRP
jgi:hypothetical protein